MVNTENINYNKYGDNQWFNYNNKAQKIQFPMRNKVYNLSKHTILSSKQNFLLCRLLIGQITTAVILEMLHTMETLYLQ